MYSMYVETLEYLMNFDLLLVYRKLGTLTYIPKVGHRDDQPFPVCRLRPTFAFYLITFIGHDLL